MSGGPDYLLNDAEVETIYAAYMLVLGLEARTLQGRREIVEPLYRAVIQARINTARQVAREYTAALAASATDEEMERAKRAICEHGIPAAECRVVGCRG